jgi:hypothetical protein
MVDASPEVAGILAAESYHFEPMLRSAFHYAEQLGDMGPDPELPLYRANRAEAQPAELESDVLMTALRTVQSYKTVFLS